MAAEADESPDDWDDYSFVIASRYRILTLGRLASAPATPKQVSSSTDARITHVSRALQELRDRSLVDLLVPDDRKKGRVYGLTDRGRVIVEMVEEHHMEEA